MIGDIITSGYVVVDGRIVTWLDLDLFTQAYLTVLLRRGRVPVRFSDLSGEALGQAVRDCAFAQGNGHQAGEWRSEYDRGWDFGVERQEGILACFSPLALSRGDDGQYRLRVASRQGRAAA